MFEFKFKSLIILTFDCRLLSSVCDLLCNSNGHFCEIFIQCKKLKKKFSFALNSLKFMRNNRDIKESCDLFIVEHKQK